MGKKYNQNWLPINLPTGEESKLLHALMLADCLLCTKTEWNVLNTAVFSPPPLFPK